MDSESLALDIVTRLKELKSKAGKLDFDDISQMLCSVIEATNFEVASDTSIYKELEGIRGAIKEAKGEAADILNEGEHQIPDASSHLDEVVKETEAAANKIIDLATEIQSAVPDNEVVGNLVTQLYEACNFGDLSRQRIVKVLKHLDVIESKLDKLFESLNIEKNIKTKPEDPNKIALSGPQLTGSAPTQDDIDALFGSL
jgi:chemotaxis protein CheZ